MKERIILVMPFIVLLALLLNSIKPETAENKTSIIKRFWILKTHTDKKFNFLICGDSRTYRGVSPEAMEEILPDYSMLNFAYSSGSFSPFMLAQIEKKLDSRSPIKVLYLGITPYSLTPKASKDGHIRQELSRKKEEIIEALYFEPVKRFFEPFQINWKASKDSVTYIQKYEEAGWVATEKIPAHPEEALAIYTKDFKNNRVSTEMIDNLMIRIKEWSEEGIKVFGCRPPTTKEMVALENRLGGFREEVFVTKFKEAGGIWLTVNPDDYNSYDGSHLDIKSSIAFSKDIAHLIGSELTEKLSESGQKDSHHPSLEEE